MELWNKIKEAALFTPETLNLKKYSLSFCVYKYCHQSPPSCFLTIHCFRESKAMYFREGFFFLAREIPY